MIIGGRVASRVTYLRIKGTWEFIRNFFFIPGDVKQPGVYGKILEHSLSNILRYILDVYPIIPNNFGGLFPMFNLISFPIGK